MFFFALKFTIRFNQFSNNFINYSLTKRDIEMCYSKKEYITILFIVSNSSTFSFKYCDFLEYPTTHQF